MASPAAQRYFSQFSQADQANIRASWGGADLMDEWYNNAVAAGATGPGTGMDPFANTGGQAISGGGTTTYSGPADTNAWQTSVGMTEGVHPDALQPSGDPFVDMVRNSARGSEDYKRFSNAQILAWRGSYDQEASAAAGYPKFRNEAGDVVDKPTESGAQSRAQGWATGEAGSAGGGGGGGGGYNAGGGGSYGGATTGFGGAPAFSYDPFKPPLPGDTTTDPSYQFRLKEGLDALMRRASARGVARTSGTDKDLVDYAQDAASQEYGNIFNRGLQTWGAQYTGQKDAFAPKYGSWSTVYGGDLSKYLQRENNIYGILNQPAPTPPYYG